MVYTKYNLGAYIAMKIAICDDDKHFISQILALIKRWTATKDLSNQYMIFQSGKQLLQADLSNVHVVFLDIEMQEINGLDVAHTLRDHYPQLIIVFVTRWIRYAPDGYRVHAFRYLLKNNLEVELPECMDDIRTYLLDTNRSISLQVGSQTLHFLLRDILFFEGTARRNVLVHTRFSKIPTECHGKLSDFEAHLKDSGFLRIQRSFLVNMAHIDAIKNKYVYLDNGTQLKTSTQNYAEIAHNYLIWRGSKL